MAGRAGRGLGRAKPKLAEMNTNEREKDRLPEGRLLGRARKSIKMQIGEYFEAEDGERVERRAEKCELFNPLFLLKLPDVFTEI